MSTIYHIARVSDWAQGREAGAYRAASLESEGFIHCSTAAQVVPVADRLFRGQRDLLLLCIAEPQVAAPVRYEAPPENPMSAERFPHIYGPLNLDAVVEVAPLEPEADGSFVLPRQLAKRAGTDRPAAEQ